MSSTTDRIPANEPNLTFRNGLVIVGGLMGLMVVLVALRFLFIYCLDVFLLGHGRVMPWRRAINEAQDAGPSAGDQQETEHSLNVLLSGLSAEERSAVLGLILDGKTVTSEDNVIWNGAQLGNEKSSTLHASTGTENTGSVQDTVCSICLQNIVIGNVVVKSKSCSHVFHRDCLLQWLERNTECPCCRSHMITEEEVKRILISEDMT